MQEGRERQAREAASQRRNTRGGGGHWERTRRDSAAAPLAAENTLCLCSHRTPATSQVNSEYKSLLPSEARDGLVPICDPRAGTDLMSHTGLLRARHKDRESEREAEAARPFGPEWARSWACASVHRGRQRVVPTQPRIAVRAACSHPSADCKVRISTRVPCPPASLQNPLFWLDGGASLGGDTGSGYVSSPPRVRALSAFRQLGQASLEAMPREGA